MTQPPRTIAPPASPARAGLSLCRTDPGQAPRGQSLARDAMVRTLREFFLEMLPAGEATPDVLAAAPLFAVLGSPLTPVTPPNGAAAALGRKGWPGAEFTPAARQRAARALEVLSDVHPRLDREIRRLQKLVEKQESASSKVAAAGRASRAAPALTLPAPLDAIFGHLLVPAATAVPGLSRPGREPERATKSAAPQTALALAHRARRVSCVAAAALSHVAGTSSSGAVKAFACARNGTQAASCTLLVLAPAGHPGLGRMRRQAQCFADSHPDPSALAPGVQEQRWLDCAARWAFAGASLALASTLDA